VAGSKYATKEEWLAAKRASKKAYKERLKAGLVTPAPPGRAKPGPKPKFATDEEKREAGNAYQRAYRERSQSKIANREAAKRTAVTQAKIIFNRSVPALLHSSVRTRFFIALCEYGPISIQDVRKYVSRTNTRTRYTMIGLLEAAGIVVRARLKAHTTAFYLNSRHPAHSELHAFGMRLASEWPSPPRRPPAIDPVPISLTGDTPPNNLFGYEERTRVLMLVAVTGGATAKQINEGVGLMSVTGEVLRVLKHLENVGFIRREKVKFKKGDALGPRPKRAFLNPDFFAYPELRMLLFALVASIYDDIEGMARAISLEDDHVAAGFLEFERATAHIPRR
jgi:hypothetical protein